MKMFTDAWGFSKLDVYRACPAKFKYQFIDKLPQQSSPALERGSRIHEELESYLNGWIAELSTDTLHWKESLDLLKAEPTRKGEQSLGFDRNWKLQENWFGPDIWLRVKMDSYFYSADTLVVIDFKTGKYRVPSTDQIELYACAGIELAPHVSEVRTEFWFIDTEECYQKTYTKAEVLEARKKFEKAVVPIYSDTSWKAAPSRECRWCAYSKTKGGPCVF